MTRTTKTLSLLAFTATAASVTVLGHMADTPCQYEDGSGQGVCTWTQTYEDGSADKHTVINVGPYEYSFETGSVDSPR